MLGQPEGDGMKILDREELRKIIPQPKVACVGTGYWGKHLARNMHSLGTLAWICETDEEQRSLLRKEYPETRVTEDVEIVLRDSSVAGVAIATPAETHGDLVRRSLLAGKDVFVEKPLSLSVAEGERLVMLAAEKSRILMVGHLLWYHPAVLKLKALIDRGELGRIQYIYSNRLNLGKIRREENILWSFAPHDVSVILGLVGETPDEVRSQGGNYLHDRITDVTVTLLSFPSGVKAHVFVSWLHPFKEQKLVIVGDRKMAVFNDVEKENKLLLYPHSINWQNNIPIASKAEAEPVAVDSTEPLRAECQHFLDCIQTRQTPRTDGKEGLRVLRVLQACQQSLEEEKKNAVAPPTPLQRPRRFFAHESAFIDDGVEIGEGTTIWHVTHVLKGSCIGKDCRIGQNVVIGPKVAVGNGVKIQNNVSVYEGVTLEDHVFCGPSMVFTNVINPRSEIRRMEELRPTLVRRGATLGANSTVVCGVTIGQYAFVGAGAVVVKDIPDYALVVGNPGRIIGWMCVCGERIRFSEEEKNVPGNCQACQRRYMKNGTEVVPHD
jgi:UDP-2-acetamido-3-amino-2,3-dideoxy-glucuronate N-acetyltransferase